MLAQLLKPDIFDILNAAISNINYSTLTVILLGLIIYMVQMGGKQQDKNEKRYTALVDKFIDSTKKLTENHEQSLKTIRDSNEQAIREILKELSELKSELKICGVHMEETNRLFIFNQSRNK